MSEEFVKVTKAEFYAYIAPRDIVVRSFKNVTLFKTRYGLVVGRTQGYSPEDGEKFFMLRKDCV